MQDVCKMFAKFVSLNSSNLHTMATIKFILHSKKENAPIYCYLSLGRGKFYQRKTRETINPDFWNTKTGKPKKIEVATKSQIQNIADVNKILPEIESFIFEQYRKRDETEIIDGNWLNEIITAYYTGGRRLQQLDFLDNYLEYYKTDVLPFVKTRGKKITDATTKKQTILLNKVLDFCKQQNRRLKVSDWDVTISNKFEQFLEKQGLAKGTIGRYVKYPKTFINHAKSLNIEISKNLDQIKGYTAETPTIFISEKELQEIQKLTFLEPQLETSKDWLVVGFYTGQRASDLFSMTPKMFLEIDNTIYINLSQQKTKTKVLIPLHDEVKKILEKRNGQFPPLLSENIDSAKTLFNKHLRTIAKKAKLERLDFGKKYDDENKKYIYGQYPICEIISSHVCRRSFATHNYITVPTPLIMAITGHKTEKEFLNYIGKDFNDLSKEMLKYWNKPKETTTETETLETKTAN